MGIFPRSSNGGIMDVIRCDEKDYLVWKWRPEGTALGGSSKENSIRWGSSLRVKEGSVAVFVYSNEIGSEPDFITGPKDIIVNTKNLPVIASVIGWAYNGSTPFQAEVYFINLANTIQAKFAVPYFDVFDSKLPEYSVPVAVRGSFDFNIEDYKAFIKKHRLDEFSKEDLQAKIKDSIIEKTKNVVANAPDEYQISVIQLEKKIAEIKEAIFSALSEKFFVDYGITLKDINLAAIEINKDSAGYKELLSVTKDLTSNTLKSRNKAQIIAETRDIKGNQTLGMLEKAAGKFVDIKESQFALHKQNQKEYADVIEDERAGKIGAIGGKLFRGIGSAVNAGVKKIGGETPPPLPQATAYYVAVGGKQTGPFDIESLSQMVSESQLTQDSLVWKKGMKEWTKAGAVEELQDLFVVAPPIPEE